MSAPLRVIPGRAKSVPTWPTWTGSKWAERTWLNHPKDAADQRRALATFPDPVARTAYYVALFNRLNHLKD
jgi:hypothetical protein